MTTTETPTAREALAALLARHYQCEHCEKRGVWFDDVGDNFCGEHAPEGCTRNSDADVLEGAERALAAGPATLEIRVSAVHLRSDIILNGELIVNNASPEIVALLRMVAEALGARVVRK